MIESPAEIAAIAVAEHGPCACRELRNELADAAHSSRLGDAQVYLSAACIVCGKPARAAERVTLRVVTEHEDVVI
ncbi:hypothetical protein [Sphingomonas sp.]|uniref:hypothetical protein n=1 Tax=Sphingomonas sp. TaxID=28214 RepID=UPI003B004734